MGSSSRFKVRIRTRCSRVILQTNKSHFRVRFQSPKRSRFAPTAKKTQHWQNGTIDRGRENITIKIEIESKTRQISEKSNKKWEEKIKAKGNLTQKNLTRKLKVVGRIVKEKNIRGN